MMPLKSNSYNSLGNQNFCSVNSGSSIDLHILPFRYPTLVINGHIKHLSHLFIILKINLIFRLYSEKCFKLNQSQGRLQKPKQPIRNREIPKFWREIYERALIGRNKVMISKKREKGEKKQRIKQKTKVSTVDIQVQRSGLNVSNSNSTHIRCQA